MEWRYLSAGLVVEEESDDSLDEMEEKIHVSSEEAALSFKQVIELAIRCWICRWFSSQKIARKSQRQSKIKETKMMLEYMFICF